MTSAPTDGGLSAASAAGSVVVIGGGIIGLCCAYFLRRAGLDVLLIERGRIGSGASLSNGGWVSPAKAVPLPAPGAVRRAVRSLVRNDGVFGLSLGTLLTTGLLPWLLGFWSHSTRTRFRHGARAMADLGTDAFALLEELTSSQVAFETHSSGLLCAFEDERRGEGERRDLERLGEYGYEMPPLLTGRDLHGFEPALSERLVAGFWVREERHVRPESLVTGLTEAIRQIGVEVQENTEVIGFEARHGYVEAVVTDKGSVTPCDVVLAAGVWTTELVPILRLRQGVVMTNSAKWAYYAPANLGVDVAFGSLEECVRSAEAGAVVRDPEMWLGA